MQPRAWTLIETEARDASVSAPGLSRILKTLLSLLMITPSKVQARNTTLQMNISEKKKKNCRFKLAHCPDLLVHTHGSVMQHLEDTV